MLRHKGTQIIKTPRLCLRRYKPEDAPTIFKNYATDTRVTKFLSWEPYQEISALKEFIAAQISAYERPDIYNWVIEYGSQVIGSISVVRNDEENESCEIGYCIGYAFWNRGFVTEALSAVMNDLFREVGYHRICAKHDVGNPASGRVMEKCRMTYEGRLRGQHKRHDGTHADVLIYGILSDEFEYHA
ncbi:GNAT family N-acetyltransferase [Oscillospiraceae bacterium OttesenSCG-928-F05]|nr:GNAT family N-acetyltransferase [Oscillospiraceae bacterium OttesenSCG-928-F05]